MHARRAVIVSLVCGVHRAPSGAAVAQEQERRRARRGRSPVRSASTTRPAPARLQDLSRSLLGLPQPQAGGVPQSRRCRRPGLHRGAGRGDRRRIQDQGRPERPGRDVRAAGPPADHFPPPFANEQAARNANGGALPPDMSVLAKARGFERGFPWFIFDVFTQYQEQGPDYIAAMLKGYADAPPASRCRRARNTTNISPATPSACRSR